MSLLLSLFIELIEFVVTTRAPDSVGFFLTSTHVKFPVSSVASIVTENVPTLISVASGLRLYPFILIRSVPISLYLTGYLPRALLLIYDRVMPLMPVSNSDI